MFDDLLYLFLFECFFELLGCKTMGVSDNDWKSGLQIVMTHQSQLCVRSRFEHVCHSLLGACGGVSAFATELVCGHVSTAHLQSTLTTLRSF